MAVGFNTIKQVFELKLKNSGISHTVVSHTVVSHTVVSHTVELGESETGNIRRIDNVLEDLSLGLNVERDTLARLQKQMENAKTELERPFSKAQELKEKTERLAQLDILLNMDEQREQEEQQENTAEGQQESRTAEANPKTGERVTFNADGGTVKLTGEVVGSDEKTVTLRCGGKEIPVFRDKGFFTEAVLEPDSAKEHAKATIPERDIKEKKSLDRGRG